jgi:hypothetical protein
MDDRHFGYEQKLPSFLKNTDPNGYVTDGRPPVVCPSSVDAPFLFAHLSLSFSPGVESSTEIRFFHTFLSVFPWSVRAALANPHCKHLLEKTCRFSVCLEMLSGEHVRRRISFLSTAVFLL